MIKKCRICGKEFETKRNKVYCSKECSKAAIRQRQLEKKPSYLAKEKAAKNKSLVDTNNEARSLGMSYGKYKAMMYLKEMGR